MGWWKNRRKNGEERETASLTPESQRDAEYLSLVDSYHSTRKELKQTAKHLQDARHLHDRESQDEFRQELSGLRSEYATIKTKLSLDGSAEFVIKYNDLGIRAIEGTARDWIVANYHLRGTVDKNAASVGIPLKHALNYTHDAGKQAEFVNSEAGEPLPPRAVTTLHLAILKKDGVFEAYPTGFAHVPVTSERQEYVDLADLKADGYMHASHRDECELRPYKKSARNDSIALMGKLTANPAYKNKIRITARRIEG